jgi:diguanylate cyclase (GGDEF)-like protein
MPDASTHGTARLATAPTRRGGLARLRARQNPHSLFVAAAGVLFGFTLVIDIVLNRPGLPLWVLWLLLGVCLALPVVAITMGRRFPVWLGFSAVVVFTAASLYFLSPWGDEQWAVASAQELPILALYLGWFVPRPLGRVLMSAITALLVLALVLNPMFHVDGVLGLPTGVQIIVITVLCFEVGSLLLRQSERRITTDQLTGVQTRGAFLERLDHDLSRARREDAPSLSIVLIDFDGFKQLNDTQGHAAGDAVLSGTVARWRSVLRAEDVIGRLGGDEFALLLEHSDVACAELVVGRLRGVSSHAWSWGIARAEPGDDLKSILARADEALYAVKRGGRP